jgi:hypothetical protein
MLIDNKLGNYRFLSSIDVFSSGVVSQRGYEIVHVTFQPLPPLRKGYDLIQRHLQSRNRPLNSLCGIELRIPQSLSSQGFREFNEPYIRQLADWKLLVEGINPVARTNVAPEATPVSGACIYGFSYTVPAQDAVVTFVMSGVPELVRRENSPPDIIAAGDLSLNGLRQKTEVVLQALTSRLTAMGISLADATAVGLYTVRDIHPLLETTILPVLNGADRYGVCWHYARPPVVQLELEIDARRVRQELVLPG